MDTNKKIKILNILKTVLIFLVPPIFVMLVVGYVFHAEGLFPFGKGTISWCDMSQQVVPLLDDLKDILSGKSGMFLNFSNAGGMNFWGVFFFFIASPFSFLVAFVKKGDMLYFVNILFVLKLMTASVTASVYFRVCQKKLSPVFAMFLSICYALSGYVMLFYQNIIWLDMMYLFPLLIVSLNSMTERKKQLPYVIIMAVMVVVNYYIGYMIVLYLLLFMAVFCYRYRKDERYVHVHKMFLKGSLFAAMLSAVVWLPSFIQYLSSGRSTSITSTLAGCDFVTSFTTILPMIFAVSSLIVIVVISTLDGRPRSKKLNTYLVMLVIMCVPLFIEPINTMWHTGNYMSFPARYGFITIFMFIICSGMYLSDENRTPPEKKFKNNPIILAVIGLGIFFYYKFSTSFVKVNFDAITKYTRSLWGDDTSFVLIFELFMVSAVLSAGMFLLYKRGFITKSFLAVFLGVFIAVEASSNLTIYVTSANSRYPEKTSDQKTVMSLSDKVSDNSFYRMKTSSKLFDVNLVGAMGYNSIGHYTSLTSRDYMYMMKEMGYSSYWMEVGSYGGTKLTDALLSVKYQISGRIGNDNIVYKNDEYEISKLDYTLPMGIITNGNVPSCSDLSDMTRAQVQEYIYDNVFGGNDKLVTEYGYQSKEDVSALNDKSPYTFEISGTNPCIYYTIEVGKKQTLYFDCFDKLSNKLTEKINGSFSITVNGITLQSAYPSQNYNGLINLGTYENEIVNIQIVPTKAVSCKSFGVFGLDDSLLENAVKSTKTVGLTQNGGVLSGTYSAKGGETCLLSVPYQSGLTVKINGEKVSSTEVLGNLTAVKLKSGTNKITVSSVPKGMGIGIAITFAGIALIILDMIWRRKNKGKKQSENSEVADIVIKFSLIVIGASVFLLVYIFPCILNIYGI